MDNTGRFSGRAQNYAASRPSYAEALVHCLYTKYGLSPASVVADIGSGTGKFAKQLLDRGTTVFCVEPNGDMRAAAEAALGGCPGFRSVEGEAGNTTLPDASVDFITAAQAFHWFDPEAFAAECRRILRPGGQIFLIWNHRDQEDPVNLAWYQVFDRFCPNFRGFSGDITMNDSRIAAFFPKGYAMESFDFPLRYDRDSFIRRSLSSSYSLTEADAAYPQYLAALEALFDRLAAGGSVVSGNHSVLYAGQL